MVWIHPGREIALLLTLLAPSVDLGEDTVLLSPASLDLEVGLVGCWLGHCKFGFSLLPQQDLPGCGCGLEFPPKDSGCPCRGWRVRPGPGAALWVDAASSQAVPTLHLPRLMSLGKTLAQ